MNDEKNGYIIYKHTAPNGKVYIGLTNKTLKQRWRIGYKHNEYFTNAIKKYGPHNFKHEVLFNGLTAEEAELKEIETIAIYRSNEREYGYNLTAGGGGRLGYKLTPEQRKTLSDKAKGRKKSEEHRKNISLANKKRFEDPEQRAWLASLQRGRKPSKETLEKYKNRNLKPVIQLDLDGNFIKWHPSLRDAAYETNTCLTYICNVCRERNESAKGYKWRYANEI